ncbi:MAG: DinB family protein [Pyrinomonadaceae bacterium]
MSRPTETEYAPSFESYVSHVTEDDILPAMRSQIDAVDVLLDRVTPERETYAYGEGKWTIRQIVGHLIDGERVFGYRALCIARGETQDLPGFDENAYMPNAPYEHIELEDLLSEFRLVRLSNIAMLRTLDETAWTRMGMANGAPVSVRALAYVMVGHARHHMGVLRERYQIGGAN